MCILMRKHTSVHDVTRALAVNLLRLCTKIYRRKNYFPSVVSRGGTMFAQTFGKFIFPSLMSRARTLYTSEREELLFKASVVNVNFH